MAYNFNPKLRITVISISIVGIALLLATKLFFVQVLQGKAYAEEAEKNFVSSSADVLNRGTIYFSRKDGKRIEAATLMQGYKITINPTLIEDKEGVYKKINEIVPLDYELFNKKASKEGDTYEELAVEVPKEKGDQIKKLNLEGVTLFSDKWRFYPGNDLAAHSIGFLAYKGDVRSGRYGLERYYNDVLSKDKENLYVNFFAEVFSNIKTRVFENENLSGDIVTTIEPAVQQFVESELDQIMEKWSSDAAGAIVMDPKDGSIIAMAYTPDFDVNNFGDVENVNVFSNPLVENVFEFGSVIKPLVMAAALDAGVVTPDTTYVDNGFVEVGGKVLNNFDKKGRGLVTMQDVITQSLNTGMVFAGQKLGNEKFKSYMLSYGIGEKTGIDLPNEATGLVSNLNSKRDLEFANMSFGQGIAMTPIEAIRAFGVLANGGYLVTPHIVKEIDYENSGVKKIEYQKGLPLLKPETIPTISRMLTVVVDKGILAGQYKEEHHTIAAKTGTAQVPLPNGKGYYDDRNLHSLFGYLPAYDPKFVVIFFTEYPKGDSARFATNTIAEPFMDTAKFLLNYYQVPPDR